MTNVLDPNFKTPTTPQEVAELCIQSIQATLERNENNLPAPKGEITWSQNIWASGEINSDNLIKIEKGDSNFIALKCPSTGCVAGTAAALAGWYLHIDRSEATELMGDTIETSSVINDRGEFSIVEDAGRDALGLTLDQAFFLFSNSRTSFEVLYILNLIKENNIYWRARWERDHYVLLDEEDKEIIAFV